MQPWRSIQAQLSFLRLLVIPEHAQNPELVSLLSLFTNRVNREGLKSLSNSADPTLQPWTCLDIVRALLRLGDTMHSEEVRRLFDHPSKTFPEILMIALAQITLPKPAVVQELYLSYLMLIFLNPHPNTSVVLSKVWQMRQSLVLKGMVDWYNSDPEATRLARVLDVAQDIKALPTLLNCNDNNFVLRLAMLAARREFLNLERWLQDRVRENPSSFCTGLVSFLQIHVDPHSQGANAGILPEHLRVMLDVLQNVLPQYAPDLMSVVHRLREIPLRSSPPTAGQGNDMFGSNSFPSLAASGDHDPPPQQGPMQMQQLPGRGDAPELVFSKDIEDEANAHFQKIYQSQLTIDEFVRMLLMFKASAMPKLRDVFACMIRNLLDEYRFFSQYPDAELGITGMLFGALIQHKVVDELHLGICLRLVLEALHADPSSKLFKFGIFAITRFKDRLREWPQYCANVCALSHFNAFPPELMSICQAHAVGVPNTQSNPAEHSSYSEPIHQTSMLPSVNTHSVTVNPFSSGPSPASLDEPPSDRPPSMGTSAGLLIAAAESAPILRPSDGVYDKVHFVFNNLSPSNLDAKSGQLKKAIDSRLYPWLAQYLVVRRVSLEPNMHAIYANFLNVLDISDVRRAVLMETYTNIHILLNSQKISASSSSSERSLLKNLGAWLGLQTIARNKPILHRDLPLKQLIISVQDPSSRNHMYIVPFVCKILNACPSSIAFRPPSPWVMAILSVFKEIHQAHKLTLRFEIELLYKHLGQNIDEIPNTTYFKDMQLLHQHQQQQQQQMLQIQQQQLQQQQQQLHQQQMLQQQLPPSMYPANAPNGRLRPNVAAPRSPGGPSLLPQVSSSDSASTSAANAAFGQGIPAPVRLQRATNFPTLTTQLSSLQPYIAVNNSIALFQQQPALEPFVRMALERAVQDLTTPVVERSARICVQSTLKLVLKDYITESDENKMRVATRTMVQHLAGSLAMVTGKEPLRLSLGNTLRTLLLNAVAPDGKPSPQQMSMVEQAATVACQDNLDLACAFIEKNAMEKSLVEVDEQLNEEFAIRHQQRGERLPSPAVLALPPILRPRASGLDAHQHSLYETFASLPPVVGSVEAALASKEESATVMPTPLPPSFQAQAPVPAKPPTDGNSNLERLIGELAHACARQTAREFTALPPGSEVHTLLRDIQALVSISPSRPETVTRLSQKLVVMLFELDGQSRLLAECLMLLLHNLQTYHATSKEVTRAYASMDNDRKLNMELVVRLLRSRVLDPRELDTHLARLADSGRQQRVVLFSEEVLRQCLLVEPKLQHLTAAEFPLTIELISRLAEASKPPREAQTSLLASIVKLRKVATETTWSSRTLPVKEDPDDPPGLRENVGFLFEDWVRSTLQPRPDPKQWVQTFISRLQQQSMLKTDDISTRFFRLCTDYSIQISLSNTSESGSPAYFGIEAYSKLVAALVNQFGDASKVALLNKVLAAIVTLTREHAANASFNPRPYHRLFANVLAEIPTADEAVMVQILSSFAGALHALRPSILPTFAFSWLDLMSHRNLMPRLLLVKPPKSWNMLQRLLVDLFTFLSPFLRSAAMNDAARLLYRGALRVMLVLLHDFPEFLCDHHFSLCDVIPTTCIQMRNLVLSAFPRNMRLPDPFTPNLKVDLLPEISQAPVVLPSYTASLDATLQQDIDLYLRTRAPVTFLLGLRSRLMSSSVRDELSSSKYNVPLFNALVLHIGVRAIDLVKSTTHDTSITHGAPMDIFQHLIVDLDAEGRYVLFNAIANQLRFPNSHTHYFSRVMLNLFAEANKEVIQEQITRVLLERLIANRPHPWGLLITFIELIKNRSYNFWEHNFVHCG